MNRKLLTVGLGFFALTALAGIAFVPTSSASPGHASSVARHKHEGLTQRSVDSADAAGRPSALVTMAPQSSLGLLSRATQLGPHAPDSRIELTIGLKLRHVAELKQFLRQVQYPGSPAYHRWLTPKEFTAQYGPSKDAVARVVAFLKAHGIAVKDVSPNRILIHTQATTTAYEHAFGIRIDDYKLDGRSFYSTTDRPKLPRTLAPLVVNVLGLDHGVQMQPHSYTRPLASPRGLSPRQAPPASLTNLNPLQIAHAYNYPDITEADNGYGVTVAILTANSSGLAGLSDPHDFWAAFGLPDHSINVIPVNGDQGATSGMGETLLDVEYAGAMGPGAKLDVYVSADAQLSTFADMYNQFVNDNSADVMTTSWGAPEIRWNPVVTDEIFMQAVAQGISMFAAAGDHGSSDGTLQDNMADYPSSSLYITAANGTQLTISDLSGSYGSEVVWNDGNCFGKGPLLTGGAISQFLAKPAWQHGPGVPADVHWRMNSGIALTASCSHPMMVYEAGGWYLTAGTSAVAPQLAGMFAIAVAQKAVRLGQSNKLIYADARNHYASDFHDVTDGNNGAYQATTNWDHPTGWGSVNVQHLISHIGIQGPKGTLAGTVTDAADGKPISGARVVAVADDGTEYKTITADDGSYSRVLPAGDFDVTVSDYGYTNGTATVSIGEGGTATKDFALAVAPEATLHGKVSDGSGHGYGLYADIKISTAGFGQVAEVWTDPETGKYSVKLPKGSDYGFVVAAAFDGYNTGTGTVALSGNQTKNIGLTVTSTCAAPGYHYANGGFSEDFNGSAFPPAGWTVVPAASTVTWMPSSQEPSDNGNYTGGTGDAAAADSGAWNQSGDPFDTSLVSPPVAVTSLHGATVLQYKANYQYLFADAFDLDISSDGGASWTNLLHWAASHGTFVGTPGEKVQVNLAPYLPASGTFQLRWRYYNLLGGWDFYAQVDDVAIGGCVPTPGGLIVGQVTDANSGEGVVDAVVTDDLGNGAKSLVNLADPKLPVGFYQFFTTNGDRALTATKGNYTAATAQVTLPADKIVQQDFALKSASFTARPSALTLHVMVKGSATASFALSNIGSTAGRFTILAVNAPPPATGAAAVPVRRIPIQHETWLDKSLFWIRAHAKPGELPWSRNDMNAWQGNVGPQDSAWVDVASYPIDVGDNAAAYDPRTGRIYSLGGVNAGNLDLHAAFVYDPGSNAWAPIADIPTGRESPVAEFINGKLYAAGGINPDGGVTETDVYDPAQNAWNTAAAPMPVPIAAAASAVLNGKLYVIGGMKIDQSTGLPSKLVQVYDSASDSWSTAADYPGVAVNPACGAIKGKIYCAGGGGSRGKRSDGYVYDPASNTWSSIADIPIAGGILGAVYGVANGKLILAGGYVGTNTAATNQVEAYDPVTDKWISLPNANHPVARAGGTCGPDGFYTVGNTVSAGGLFTFDDTVQKLSGYVCSGGGISWLTVAPAQGILNAGNSMRIALAIDGSKQQEFTTTQAYLRIMGAPKDAIVPLTVTWEPQPVNLVLDADQSPNPLQKGGNLTYTLTVGNQRMDGHGAATRTLLTYPLPDGVSYIASNGDAVCTAPPMGSSPAPSATAAGTSPGLVTCDFGTIDSGAAKTVTIAVKVTRAGTLASHFSVSAREPNDSDQSALDINTTVIGSADVSASTSAATIHEGGRGMLRFAVSNAGPDPATDVQFKLNSGGSAKLTAAESSQGSCTVSDGGAYSCDVGEIEAGGKVEVTLTVFGLSAGTATVQGQALTSSDDPDQGNNVATATVTVKAADNGGGGALGWLVLSGLLGLTLAAACADRRRRMS